MRVFILSSSYDTILVMRLFTGWHKFFRANQPGRQVDRRENNGGLTLPGIRSGRGSAGRSKDDLPGHRGGCKSD